MLIRQRLRSVVEGRQASQICWSCALLKSRHDSTARPPVQESSVTRKSRPTVRITKHVSGKIYQEDSDRFTRKLASDTGDAEGNDVGEHTKSHYEYILPQPRIFRIRKHISNKRQTREGVGEQTKSHSEYILPQPRIFRIRKFISNKRQTRESVKIQIRRYIAKLRTFRGIRLHSDSPPSESQRTISQILSSNKRDTREGSVFRWPDRRSDISLHIPRKTRIQKRGSQLSSRNDAYNPKFQIADQDASFQEAVSEADTAKGPFVRHYRAKNRLVRRAYGLRKHRNITESPGNALVIAGHPKQREHDSLARETFRFVKFTGKNERPVYIKEHPVETDFRKSKTDSHKSTDACQMPSKAPSQNETLQNQRQRICASYNQHDELDMLLDKLRNSPKRSPIPVTTVLPKSAPSYSIAPRQRKLRRNPMKANFRFGPRTYTTVAAGYWQQRLASTLAPQIADVSQDASPLLYSKDVQGSEYARPNIRERLQIWKSTGSNGSKPSSRTYAYPQSWSNKTINIISQSGGNDEPHIDVAPVDDLDAGWRLDAKFEGSVLDDVNPQLFIRQGDLVDLNVSGISILGIVIKQANGVATSYTERGTWHQFPPKYIKFSIPHLVSSHEASGLLPYLEAPKSDLEAADEPRSIPYVPRDVGSILIRRMAEFLRASDAVFREHADRLNRAYEILTQDEPEGHTLISLEDAALKIFQKKAVSDLTPPMLLIVHRTLSRSQNILQHNWLHRLNPIFKILPRATLAHLNIVGNWVREYQDDRANRMTESLLPDEGHSPESSANPLETFAAKALRIISFNRSNRPLSPIGTVGPSSTKVELNGSVSSPCSTLREHQESFDDNEQQIIGFLGAWSMSGQINRSSDLMSLGPMILRTIGMYRNMALNRVTGCTLLQEMGIVKPWERGALFESQLELPGHDPHHPATILRDQALKSLSGSPPPLQDSMLAFRKDLGDSRVYCVDSLDTVERDDGISLEAADGDDSLCWVHVHVANPSAFLSRDSPLARYAHYASATVYFPEYTYPMLEAEPSRQSFSLAKGRPCITFSAKISRKGDIIEQRITHNTLNDVRYLTLEQLTQAVDGNAHVVDADRISMLTVGTDILRFRSQKPPPKSPEDAGRLDESDIRTLRKLYTISKTLESRRIRDGAMLLNARAIAEDEVVPHVYISGDESRIATFHARHSRLLVGDPTISIERVSGAVSGARDMVAEYMLLAGQTCAMWCSERNIPIPYRGVFRNPNPSMSPESYRESVLGPAIESPGGVDEEKWLTYMSLLGTVYTSSSPLEHSIIGLPVYCKTTSPLRRYIDLFTHWQIEGAMRYEHANGRSLVGRVPAFYEDAAVLPFSCLEVEDAARKLFAREKQIQWYSRRAHKHWVTQALHRAFYFQEAPLPSVFETIVRKVVRNESRDSSWAYLPAWRLSARLQSSEASDQQGGFQVGDMWEATLKKVDPRQTLVVLDPVRLVSRR